MTWKPLLLAASLFTVPACPAQVTVAPDPSEYAPTVVHYTWRNASSKPIWPRISLRDGEAESTTGLSALPPLSYGTMTLTLASLRPVCYSLFINWEKAGCAAACEDSGDGKTPPQSGILSNAVKKEAPVDLQNGLVLATVIGTASSSAVPPFFKLTVSSIDPATLPGAVTNTSEHP